MWEWFLTHASIFRELLLDEVACNMEFVVSVKMRPTYEKTSSIARLRYTKAHESQA